MPRSAVPRLARRAETRVSDVTVMFRHAALIFALPAGATLADLAERIARIAKRQFGGPLSVAVTLHA
jgi:hypothetical protein